MFNSTKMTETVPDSCGFPNLMIPKACFKPTDSKWCCLVLHAHQYSSKIATDMKENLYVDNLISGQPTENDVTHYYKSARSIMTSGNFNLRAWASNSQQLQSLCLQEGTADTKTTVTVVLKLLSQYVDRHLVHHP